MNSWKSRKIRAGLSVFFAALWTAASASFLVARAAHHRLGIPRDLHVFDLHKENRAPAPFPDFRALKPKDWGDAAEAWYGDSFAFRDTLIDCGGRVVQDFFHAPRGRIVPGRDGFLFRRGDFGTYDWPEAEDYLGALRFRPEDRAAWLEFLEGTREYCDAVGVQYIELIAPVKGTVQTASYYAPARNHPGKTLAMQMRELLEDSPAKDAVLLPTDTFAAEAARGVILFQRGEDHHYSPVGQYRVYETIAEAIRARHPEVEMLPFETNPSPDLLEGNAAGCCARGLRLHVANPAERDISAEDPFASTFQRKTVYPYRHVCTVRDGGGLTVVMAHDSMMRFTLTSWKEGEGTSRFPFGAGVGTVRTLMYSRLDPDFIDTATKHGDIDVLVEQIAESKLSFVPELSPECAGKLRAAARFSRGTDLKADFRGTAGRRVVVRAVMDDVFPGGVPCAPDDFSMPREELSLLFGGAEVGRSHTYPGKRRAVYFEVDDLPAASVGAEWSVRFSNPEIKPDRVSFAFRLCDESSK